MKTSSVYFFCVVAAFGGLLFGYDWVVIGGAKPFYELYFGIDQSPLMQGVAMTTALIGCLVGAMVAGSSADRYGRKPLLMVSAVLFTLSAIATGLFNDFTMFNIARFIGGVGIGVASALAPMYIAEVSPAPRTRSHGQLEPRNLVNQRDDLLIEYATLLNQTGQYLAAKELIDNHCFHPWEGGEGKVSTQYQVARVKLAIRAIAEQRYNEAVTLLTECLDYPHHLGEGKLYGAQENDFYYFLGLAHEALGNDEMARHCFEQAIHGTQEPAAALYYNDAKPDKIFYQGMALLKLGRQDEANGRFYKLINYGKNHYFDKVQMDYFAVSLPDLLIWEDSLDVKNIVHCCYMLALGYFGLGEKDKARKYLSQVEALDINHLGVMQVKDWMQS